MTPQADKHAEQRRERRRAWLLGLALLYCYAYFFYLGGNWNVESHYAQVWALAEHGSLVIDGYPFLPAGGGDAARFEGHYYSDKLIGPSLLAAPVYWPLRHLGSLAGLNDRIAVFVALRVVNVFVNALPSALLGALLYLFLAEFGIGVRLRAWLTLAYGLGTLALPYSTVFFGHQLAAVALTGAFMLLWRGRERLAWTHSLGAGALVGFAAISDAMGMFAAALLGGYALWLVTRWKREGKPGKGSLTVLLAFVGAAGAIFAIQLAANWVSFDRPLAFPHLYHAQAAFRARHTAGLFGLHLPQLYPLYQLTIGAWRGLFYGSPVLLLALPGFFLFAKKWRAEAILLAATWLLVLLLSSGYENWTTGSAYGPRYQIVVLPFLLLAAAPAVEKWPFAFSALALLSITCMVIVTAQSPFLPEDLRNPLATALAQFAQGNLQHGNLGMLVGLPGLASLLPLALVEAVLLWRLKRVV